MSRREKLRRNLRNQYYLSLPYAIEIIPDEGAWFARIKELSGCMTEVDNWEDIPSAIEEAKWLWVELALERGRPIPEPQNARA
jgi:antitoxin HicB